MNDWRFWCVCLWESTKLAGRMVIHPRQAWKLFHDPEFQFIIASILIHMPPLED